MPTILGQHPQNVQAIRRPADCVTALQSAISYFAKRPKVVDTIKTTSAMGSFS